MPIGHIDLRVGDLARAQAFYDELLPTLGYDQQFHGGEWRVWATAQDEYFAVTGAEAHAPNENRIAFVVGSRDEVDAAAGAARAAGALDVSGPKEMPYGPGYYAVYFADPDGNRFEVYVRP